MSRPNDPHLAAFAAPLLALALAACGGGGGGDAAPAAATGAPLTPDNAPAVAAEAYKAADALYDSGSLGTTQLKEAQGGAAPLDLVRLATSRLLSLDARPATEGRTTKAVTTVSEACPDGGTSSATFDDADGDGALSTGDSGSFSFVGCRFADVVLSGRFAFSGVVVTGTPSSPSRSIAATFTFESMTASGPAGSGSASGDVSIQAAIAGTARQVIDVALAGNSLTVVENARTRTLSGYSGQLRLDEGAGSFRYAVQGTVSGTGLPGTVSVTTPTAFVGTIGGFPASGAMLLRAADGSAARVTATSPVSVTLEVDANADGAFESSSTLTWAQLVGA